MLALLLRLVGARHSRHVITLLGLAVACVVAGGALFAATQHIPLTTGAAGDHLLVAEPGHRRPAPAT